MKAKVEKMMRDTVDDIGQFLYSRQVTTQSVHVTLEQTSIVSKPFLSAPEVTWQFRRKHDAWEYRSGSEWQRVPSEGIFRLPIFGIEYSNVIPDRKEFSGLIGKFRKYKHYPDFLIRIWLFVRRAIGSMFSSEERSPLFNSALRREGGITFRAVEVSPTSLKLECLDTGGIYDKNLNGEGAVWPDQVPVGYYAASYGSYVFYALWKQSGDMKWLSGAKAAVQFFVRNEKPYTFLAFDHYEFNVLPLALLLHEIEEAGDSEHFPVHDLKKLLSDRWHAYDPVNVSALRLANAAALERLGVPVRAGKKKRSLSVVEKNQTKQGLIMDNTGGAVRKSADLTYHQFSLACLMVAFTIEKDLTVKNIIEKGLSFSRLIGRPDGHVSYFGRGANNIYHLASYIFVELASGVPRYDSIAQLMEMFSMYVDSDTGLPSALNQHADKRMGWNHCGTPYNAQTGFFLCLALQEMESRKTTRKLSAGQDTSVKEDLDYAHLRLGAISAIIGRGSDAQVWSEGAHITGMGGLCSLSIDGLSLMPAVGFSVLDGQWVATLSQGQDSVVNPFQDYAGVLTQIEEHRANFKCRDIQATYSISTSQLQIVHQWGAATDTLPHVGALPMLSNAIEHVRTEDASVTLQLKNGYVLNIKPTSQHVVLEEKAFTSNPFGRGIQFCWKPTDKYTEKRFELIIDIHEQS